MTSSFSTVGLIGRRGTATIRDSLEVVLKLLLEQGLDWSLDAVIESSPVPAQLATDIDTLVEAVAAKAASGDQVVVMSNGSFGGIHEKLLARLGEGGADV